MKWGKSRIGKKLIDIVQEESEHRPPGYQGMVRIRKRDEASEIQKIGYDNKKYYVIKQTLCSCGDSLLVINR